MAVDRPWQRKIQHRHPLIANLTDDDNNGSIDLCDVPDVLVVASTSSGFPNAAGHIYVLDGATGAQHFMIACRRSHRHPALGDIDNDGLPEIIAAIVGGNLIAFEHDGALKWQSASAWPEAYSGAIALADVDNDGDVEIVAGNRLYDHNGLLLWTAPQPAGNWSATAAADLDDDGDPRSSSATPPTTTTAANTTSPLASSPATLGRRSRRRRPP